MQEDLGKESGLVSIVIPAYNYAEFLPYAIESALNQTYPDVEVIVVDDGSTDGTDRVAESYRTRIQYVQQENQGLSAARNSGIRQAKGKYLVFLDSDDILKPEMVEISLREIQNLNSNFAVLAHLPEFIDERGELIDRSWGFPSGDTEVSCMDLMVKNRFPTTLLALKAAFDKVGLFDTTLNASEDRDMWIRISQEFRVYRLDRALSYIRRHERNMSLEGDGGRQVGGINAIHHKVWKNHYLNGWRSSYWLKIRSFFWFQKAMMIGNLNPPRAIGNLMISVCLWPIFLDAKKIGQPHLFRMRLLARNICFLLFERD